MYVTEFTDEDYSEQFPMQLVNISFKSFLGLPAAVLNRILHSSQRLLALKRHNAMQRRSPDCSEKRLSIIIRGTRRIDRIISKT
jgi:hypothetical protein